MQNPEFWQRFETQYGSATADCLRKALKQPACVSLRLNTRKFKGCVPATFTPVPWCQTGYYLDQRPAFTFDPLFHAGAYYVQEAGSMFLEQALRQHTPDGITLALDLCAAPGGKSTLMRSLLPDDCWLVSNEPIGKRAQVLAENIIKWGHPHCIVTQNYPRHFARYKAAFDLIVADVPCSGEGMFRREAEAVAQWSTALVDDCAALQRSIIQDVWPALRPGGILVYSTCTYNRHEDEDNVEWICSHLGAEPLHIDCNPQWGIIGHHHFIPGCTRSEGFFLAAVRKNPSAGYTATRKNSKPAPALLAGLNLLHCGRPATVLKGKVEIPSPALALSIEPCDYPMCEVDAATALSYLRGECININAPRGFVLITHRGMGLGFVKNLGNRANNLYNEQWRVRSTYGTPATVL